MAKKLPIKLGKQPVVEAVFEVRFGPSPGLSTILPGWLFSRLEGGASGIESLPAAGLPVELRSKEAALTYAPLVRLSWRDYKISIGDRSVTVNATGTYPGWTVYKKHILDVLLLVISSGFVHSVDRYSIKYVNILESLGDRPGLDSVDLELRLGSLNLGRDSIQVRVEQKTGEFISIASIAGSAHAGPPISRSGTLVDIDSVCNYTTNDLGAFAKDLESRLDKIRLENKAVFFECLTDSAIESLEPNYEQPH